MSALRVPFDQYAWPAKQGVNPFVHQVVTVKSMLMNKRLYVLNDMGTGKTLSALWATDFLIVNDKIKRALIIAPLSTLGAVWGNELFVNLPHRKYAIAHGSRDKKIAAIRSNSDYVIINTDGVTNLMDEIIAAKFDIIIIDELTSFKNPTTKRTKAMMAIANKARAVWGMTGNPVPDSPMDAFGQAHVVNPMNRYLPRYKTRFRMMTMYQVTQYLWLPKEDATKTIFKILQPAIRFKREDCIDLPDMTFEDAKVDLSKQQRDMYNEMRKDMLVEYQDGQEITAKSAASKLIKLLQIGSGCVKDDNGTIIELDIKPRLEYAIDIFNQTPQRKLIIVCMFRATCIRLTKEFNDKGIKTATIYGSVNQNERARIVRSFGEDDGLEIVIVQVATVAHGVTLTSASTMLFWDLTPSFGQYEQICARIRRISQTRKQLIIHMLSTPADKHYLGIVGRKEAFSSVVMELFRDVIHEAA